MVFAGPVFPEWYWGPIFFAVLSGPPLAVVAGATDFAVRRWVRPLRLPQRAALWAGVVAAGTVAILGGRALVDHLRFERASKAAAASFDFTPYAPPTLPPGFDVKLVRADDHFDPVLVMVYDVGRAGYAQGYEQRASTPTLEPGHCSLTRLAGAGTNFFDGPCAQRRTPAGREVFVARSAVLARGREAFAVLDGTLVRLQSSGVPERQVLAWFDALRPVQPARIDFKGP
jgi:hypothetical protein